MKTVLSENNTKIDRRLKKRHSSYGKSPNFGLLLINLGESYDIQQQHIKRYIKYTNNEYW